MASSSDPSSGCVRPSRGSGGVVRVAAKLKAAVECGNFYEAHQMYRTLYYRLQTQKKYVELESLLYEGAVCLFDAGQDLSAVDLTKLYVQVLQEGKMDTSEKHFQRVARLYSRIPTNSPEKDSVMASVIRWSEGNHRLHQIFAYTLWSSKRYPESRHHFLHSGDGVGCGAMLVEFHLRRGYTREVDLFVAATVLKLICLKRHVTAACALKEYTEKHPEIKRGPPYIHPLLNFLWLLLLAIEHKHSLSVFSILVDKYKPSISRDPGYLEYLDKIGIGFFGLPPPQRQRPGGMFTGLFDSIFSALGDDEGDEGDEGRGGQIGAANPERSVRMETEELD